MKFLENRTISRILIRRANIYGWGIPGLLMYVSGIYMSLTSPVRDSIGGLTILLLYIAFFTNKKSVNQHISFLFETEAEYLPLKNITTTRLTVLWWTHIFIPWIPFMIWGRNSVLFLAFMNLEGLLYLTYSIRYIRTFSPNKVNL